MCASCTLLGGQKYMQNKFEREVGKGWKSKTKESLEDDGGGMKRGVRAGELMGQIWKEYWLAREDRKHYGCLFLCETNWHRVQIEPTSSSRRLQNNRCPGQINTSHSLPA